VLENMQRGCTGVTFEQMKQLPLSEQKELFNRLSELRKKGKTTNYSSTYGVGKAKLARDLGVTLKVSSALLKAYWDKNWAIKKVAESQEVKSTGKTMWLKNPVSGFWYQLRSERDIWSTLNQGSGTYCFDTWVYFVRKLGVVVVSQFHDEILIEVDIGKEEETEALLKEAMVMTNDKLKLNVPLGIDVQFGKNYGQVH